MTTDQTREVRCRRTVNDGKDRCPWRGPIDTFPEHTEDTGHEACCICKSPLTDDETHTCQRCVKQTHDDLKLIQTAYAELAPTVAKSGYRMGRLPGGDALVMLADGSMESPQTPNQYTEPRDVAPTVHVEHPAIIGVDFDHPPYVEERVPSDGREHVRDHWKTDPVSIVAELEAIERGWRHALGHGPADNLSTVTSCIGYLRQWLPVAARQLDDFDDFARELRELRSRIMHTAGLADDPDEAPAECFECGGRLYRPYRPLRRSLNERLRQAGQVAADDDRRIRKHMTAETQKHPDRPEDRKRVRVPARSTRVRHAVAGDDREGRSDTLVCSKCHRTYDEAQYAMALRTRANSTQGWVAVRVAAETLRRPVRTLWRWIEDLEVPSACALTTRRVVVDWEAVKALSDTKDRRNRAKEAS